MGRLFKVYVTSICFILLGQFIIGSHTGSWQYNVMSAVLLVLLFTVSINAELMKKKEFLFMQLGLMIVLCIVDVTSIVTIVTLLGGFDFSKLTVIMSPIFFWFGIAFQMMGYIAAIICLIKYNQ